jgi:NAD(P)-dependent dehydrogenase (short-subunit alcohol dehydrogenase family)
MEKNYLVFGANGNIGSACKSKLESRGQVFSLNHDTPGIEFEFNKLPEFDGVIWAQGINLSDSISNFSVNDFDEVISANVSFILTTTNLLLEHGKLKNCSQLVVVSSIWSHFCRPNKLSYAISKSALSGLIRSLAIDLGARGIAINGISPGPIDNEMTRNQLSSNQIDTILSETPLGKLVPLESLVNTIICFVTGEISGVTGQELVIDGGWGLSKLVAHHN